MAEINHPIMSSRGLRGTLYWLFHPLKLENSKITFTALYICKMKHIIDTLSRQDIEQGPIPLSALLDNSLYYPSAGHDGGVIKDCNTRAQSLNIRSFIYADYCTGPDAYREQENNFRGYHIFGSRALRPEDLAPIGWRPVMHPDIRRDRYTKYMKYWKPFAHWTVYERNADRHEAHGPERFSLIYIGSEGVATYQSLYNTQRIVPAAICIIQPGTGFGLNWTDFRSPDEPLHWAIEGHPIGKPSLVYYGGYGSGYEDLAWPGYKHTGQRIKSYYSDRQGEVTIWKQADAITNEQDIAEA